MCGITGIIGSECKPIVTQMNSRLPHRGPDDSGIFADMQVGLGHTRLSILDLSKLGKQPMQTKNTIITYNGEIYNHLDLRKRIKIPFKSKTDTETLLLLYEQEGMKMLELLNGMFSFAIYDKVKKKVFLVRDRLGIKPLYYTQTKDHFAFGSEIKALLEVPNFKREVNPYGVSSYLSYRYTLGSETLFKRVFKLLPGTYLEYDLQTKKHSINTYWELPSKKINITYKEAVRRTREEVEKAVERRLLSDVSLGTYLSGGVDSGIVSAIVSKHQKTKTFTVGFEGENEFLESKKTAEHIKSEHHEIHLTTQDYIQGMHELINFRDEPLGVPNEVPLYRMSQELKKHITVVLSGEGADEIFLGYGRKFREAIDIKRLLLFQYLPHTKFFSKKKHASPFDHFLHTYGYFSKEEKSELLKTEFQEKKHQEKSKELLKESYDSFPGKHIDKVSYLFEKHHLPGLLARVDSTTMATAVEGRVPFVDHELVSFAFSLPTKYKLAYKSPWHRITSLLKTSGEISEVNDIPKRVLKDAFRDLLPQEVFERKKKGFVTPIEKWIENEFLDYAKTLLLNEDARILMFIKRDVLSLFINQKGKRQGQKIWMLVNLEIWMREYL